MTFDIIQPRYSKPYNDCFEGKGKDEPLSHIFQSPYIRYQMFYEWLEFRGYD